MNDIDEILKDERIWSVYVHTNKINGKMYVGITSQDVNRRWKNGSGYSKQVFGRAIKKYGWDNFKHDVIATNLTEKEAKLKEIEWIESLRTYLGYDDCNGYNITLGGEGTVGYKFTDELKERLSKIKIGREFTDEHRLNLSIALKGKKCATNKKVECDGVVFESLKKCADYYGVKSDTMGAWLKGKNNMPVKFIDLNLQYYGKSVEYTGHSDVRKNFKSVICNNVVYSCVKECADIYDVHVETMRSWLVGKNRMPKMFIDLGLDYELEKDKCVINKTKPKVSSRAKQVICDGVVFDSISLCAKHYGVVVSTMTWWLNNTHKMPNEFIDKGLMLYSEYTKLIKEKEREAI